MHITYQHTIFKILTKGTLYITLLLFLTSNLYAQEKFHYHYTADEGLPSNVVYKVIQDQEGFIYVCTEKGVAKYDGYSFKSIENIAQKLSSNDVWELIIDKYNRKWFFIMDADPVVLTNGKSYSLSELAPMKNGKLYPWFMTSYTIKYGTNKDFLFLNRYDSTAYYLNKKNEPIQIKLPRQRIEKFLNVGRSHLTFENEKLIIVDFEGHLETYNLNGELLSKKTCLKLTEHVSIHQDELFDTKSKFVIFKIDNNLYTLDNEQVNTFNYQSNSQKPFSIIGIGRNHIYIKEQDILYTINKKTGNKILFSKSIKGARQVFEDKEKNIWIASQEDGLYQIPFHAKNTKIFNQTNGLAYPKITSMAFDRDGLLYLGNNYRKEISTFDGSNFQTIPKDNRKDYFIHVDKEKNIWLAGINLITDQRIQTISNTQRAIENKHKQIGNKSLHDIGLHPKSYCRNGSTLFFGRKKLYQTRLQGNSLIIDSIANFDHTIYALEPKSPNELYVGTTNGINLLNLWTKKLTPLEDKLLMGNIRDVKYIRNELWVASDKNGLIKYDPAKKESIQYAELKGKTISDIHHDSLHNQIWISTNNGLFKVTVIGGNKYSFQQFTISNGLPANEINCCLTRDNKVYVGTAKGLAIFPNDPIDSSFEPQIYNTRFNVNDIDLPISTTYNLKHNENHIIIELTALSFSSLGNVYYHYRLQGADNKWSSGKTRTLEYPSLPPGNYTLLANAIDANGKETSNQIKININIEPPVNQTWWFKLLAIILLIALLSAFFYWRSKERNKKIELEKQFSNLKLEALQSQLNSHFIFNALNAIQAYIIQKDERAASKYMSQFAKLMRAFLDSSRNRTISMADEIEFIKTYVSLESIIYENKFDTEIAINPDLDITQKIPSNITQPFIENAILHGLMPLKRKGSLRISFEKKEGLVAQFIIEDNGAGYNSAKKNEKIKSKSHGQNIIHERIDILKKDHELEVDIKIIDRKKQSNQDGTIIKINFKNNGAD